MSVKFENDLLSCLIFKGCQNNDVAWYLLHYLILCLKCKSTCLRLHGYCDNCRALRGCGLSSAFPYQLASLPRLQKMKKVFNLSLSWLKCMYINQTKSKIT